MFAQLESMSLPLQNIPIEVLFNFVNFYEKSVIKHSDHSLNGQKYYSKNKSSGVNLVSILLISWDLQFETFRTRSFKVRNT